MARRTVYLAVTILLMAPSAVAQEAAVEGHVLAVDGAALGTARVALYHQTDVVYEAIADRDGAFSLPAVAAGEYRLAVSLDGYHRVEQVEVWARPRTVDAQSTGSSRVLTRRALDALNAPVAVDVPTLAEYQLPGAVIGHDNFVHVRGNELSLHQFINGVSFLDNSHRHFTPGFSPQIFETVSIMSGGFPAEFGNRYGGILDVTTRSGRALHGGGSATIGLGAVGSRDGAFDYGGSAGRWGYYVYGGAFHSDRFLNPPEPEERHASGRSTRTVAQIDYQGDKNLVKLFVSGGDSGFDLPNTLAEDEAGRDARRELQSLTGILSWSHILSSRALLTGSLYARNVSDDLMPTPESHTTFADGSRQTRTLGGKLDWFQSVGGHRLKAGVDVSGYRLRETFVFDARLSEAEEHGDESGEHHNEDPGAVEVEHHEEEEGAHSGELSAFAFSGRQNNELVAAYVQDRFNPVENLTVDLGLRLDHLNMIESYTEISPRVGLAYRFPRTGSVLRAAYNRLFTPPPIEHLLLANFLGNAAEDAHDRVGNVKPYSQHHFEVGLSQQVHDDVVVDVGGYRHDGDHAFETSEISNTRLFVPTNFQDAQAYGLELGLDFRPLAASGISGRVQYALAKVEFVGPVSGGFAAEEHGAGEVIPPAFDQRHTFSSNIVYRQPWRNFQAGAIARYGSGTPSEQHHDGGPAVFLYLPDHWTVDLNARLNLWTEGRQKIDLEFDVTNLTDNVYAIAKESETTPLQYAMRRVVGGGLRVSF